MVLYPEAAKKAQAEIDSVVGNSRLPDFKDRPSLPYVEAFYREVMRWHPVGPIGELLIHGRRASFSSLNIFAQSFHAPRQKMMCTGGIIYQKVGGCALTLRIASSSVYNAYRRHVDC